VSYEPPPFTGYRWRRPSRLRRWGDLLRDVPLLLADRIGDDQEPRWLRALMLLVILAFGLAVGLWVAAWRLR